MNWQKELTLQLFESWLKDKHPNYHLITGLIAIGLVLLLLLGFVFIWFFSWWWKYELTMFVIALVIKYIHKLYTLELLKKFAKDN